MSLDRKKKTSNLLGICLKAGKIVKGFDSACEAAEKGSAACIITASDASPKTVKEVGFVGGKFSVPTFSAELSKAEIAMLCGKETAVLAVCDKGFADAFAKIFSH